MDGRSCFCRIIEHPNQLVQVARSTANLAKQQKGPQVADSKVLGTTPTQLTGCFSAFPRK